MVGQSGWRRGRIKIWWLGNSRHPDENDVDDDQEDDDDDDDYGARDDDCNACKDNGDGNDQENDDDDDDQANGDVDMAFEIIWATITLLARFSDKVSFCKHYVERCYNEKKKM